MTLAIQAFHDAATGTVSYVVHDPATRQAAVIDPVLDYASYFGDSGAENAMGVATDSAGNVYVTGRTTSTSGALAPLAGGSGGSGDIYVAKFSADLSTLLWATRIGGTGDEQGNAIAVDASGNVAVMGGLMEDMLDNTRDTTPGLSSLPVLGNLFQNKNDNKRKTELIIFVRPTIIQSPSLEADYKGFRNRVPGNDFFDNNPGPAWPPGTAGTTGSPS